MEGLIIYSLTISNMKVARIFIKLLSDSKFNIDTDFENFVTDCVNNHEVALFNEDEISESSITYNEIFKAIMSMSNGKAPGPDGIIIEMLKAASHMLCPIMLSLYNTILDTGDYPEI